MTKSLEAALVSCDRDGIHLGLNGDKITVSPGFVGGLDDATRATIKAQRDELIALLAKHPRCEPEAIPFVSKSLSVKWLEASYVNQVPAIYVDDTPFYRVTPAVLAWFGELLDKRYAKPHDTTERKQVFAVINELVSWMTKHYRPDQIIRGLEAPSLPALPKPIQI